MTPEEIEQLAQRLAELMPGYLLLRDPPVVPIGSPELDIGTGASPIPPVEEEVPSDG